MSEFICDKCNIGLDFPDLGILASLDDCGFTSSMTTLCIPCRDEQLMIELRESLPNIPIHESDDFKLILNKYFDEKTSDKFPMLKLLVKSKIERP